MFEIVLEAPHTDFCHNTLLVCTITHLEHLAVQAVHDFYLLVLPQFLLVSTDDLHQGQTMTIAKQNTVNVLKKLTLFHTFMHFMQ